MNTTTGIDIDAVGWWRTRTDREIVMSIREWLICLAVVAILVAGVWFAARPQNDVPITRTDEAPTSTASACEELVERAAKGVDAAVSDSKLAEELKAHMRNDAKNYTEAECREELLKVPR